MNLIWNKESVEIAFTKGYEIEDIKIFNKECETFLFEILTESFLLKDKFSNIEDSLDKATWLILNDILSSNYDCLQNLKAGNIRMASRIFRDNMENMNIAEFLNESGNTKFLKTWYKDEIISHSEYRNWLKQNDVRFSELIRDVYRIYSKYAHRTYKTILENYSVTNENKLEFKYFIDINKSDDLKLISKYYSHLSYFISNSVLKLAEYSIISKEKLSEIALKHIGN